MIGTQIILINFSQLNIIGEPIRIVHVINVPYISKYNVYQMFRLKIFLIMHEL
jgi:hypothetical protein